jgi:hypothetical protein
MKKDVTFARRWKEKDVDITLNFILCRLHPVLTSVTFIADGECLATVSQCCMQLKNWTLLCLE